MPDLPRRCLLALPFLVGVTSATRGEGPASARISACFTPTEHCAERIVAAIDHALTSVRVQAYGFTSRPILSALVAAHRRGVDVQIILDKTDDPMTGHYTGAAFVVHAGIHVWIDDLPAIAHNKIIVIDGKLVIGGSYNFTEAAETRNAENVTFIDSPDVAAWYLANWTARQRASRPLR